MRKKSLFLPSDQNTVYRKLDSGKTTKKAGEQYFACNLYPFGDGQRVVLFFDFFGLVFGIISKRMYKN